METRMRRIAEILLSVLLLALLIGQSAARDPANIGKRAIFNWSSSESSELIDPGLRGMHVEAAVDTYCIVWYDFESMNWQGWSRIDNTAQVSNFFHVDDFASLGGGSFGRLVAIEGTKSMWCGARPNATDPYLCSWVSPPGYGNSWNQILQTSAISFVGVVAFSYHGVFDCESGFDFICVDYDAGEGDWQTIVEYTGVWDSVAVHANLAPGQTSTKLRFHFTSDAAWSDQDGLDTDGAAIVDSLVISDASGVLDYEDFESASVGDKVVGIWTSTTESAFGSYASLRNNLSDKDPCADNFATQIVFFTNACPPSSSYPGLYDTPFCTGPGGLSAPCQNEAIISPVLDLTKYSIGCNSSQTGTIPAEDLELLGGAEIRFTAYCDQPLENLVFFTWAIRRIDSAGCPGLWNGDDMLYYYTGPAYFFVNEDVGAYIAADTKVQLAISCIDLCDEWYSAESNCAQHTPSPWIDNVRFYRYKSSGPQWIYREAEFFHDFFAVNENNVARKANACAISNAAQMDSACFYCDAPDGLASNTFGPEVYLHVKVTKINADPIVGEILVVNDKKYGRFVAHDTLWTTIQCALAPKQIGAKKNKFIVGLNTKAIPDGYEAEYYFTAKDKKGRESRIGGFVQPGDDYFTMAALPKENARILIVKMKQTLSLKTIYKLIKLGYHIFKGDVPDIIFDIIDELWSCGNCQVDVFHEYATIWNMSGSLSSQVTAQQLMEWYDLIVWDCGNYANFTISNDDCRLLVDWMNYSTHPCGLWICGDDVAYDLNRLGSPLASELMNYWCGVDFMERSYYELTGGRMGGGIASPLITGDTDAGIFVHGGTPDKFYAFGGCPIIDQFDVLEKAANGKYALTYPAYAGNNYYAAIASENTNNEGFAVRTMWFGFGYNRIRDDVLATPMDRFDLTRDVLQWMGMTVKEDITIADLPKVNRLYQNFPNPFNPSTEIIYCLRQKGLVTIKVYNAGGQLVRTLVNEIKEAGSYTLTWHGTNNRGNTVASGIYFYKMEAKGFGETKKMVLLR